MSGPLSGTIAAHNSDALVFEGNALNAKPLQLKEATLTSPKNAILLKAGHLLVSATDSVMTGDIKAQKGAVLDLNLIGSDVTKSVLTGAILNARNVSIDSSTWDITAHSDIVNLSNDGSDFRFVNKNGTAPTAAYSDFKTVTVKNYTGLNDAHIYLNTRLNGDDVTGAGSDKIVVRDGGSMSGTTTFHFANAGGAGAATYDGIQFVEAKGSATVDKSQMKIAGGYVLAGAYGYVGRQGQYTHSADNQSLFLTNFVPKGATVDGHGFLTGGVGVTPQKSAEVASGSGTGVGGHFSEAPTDGTSTGNRHIDKQGHSVCDNGSTSAGCLLPVTNRAGNAIIYTSELDSTGKTDDVTVTETGEVLPSKPNTKLAKILTKTPNLDSKSKVVPDSHLDSKSGSNVPVVAPIQPAPKSLISPDFVTYNAAADVVSLSANTLLGSYHERMGAQNTPLIQAEKATSYNPNSWGRLVADTREVAYGNAAFDQSVKGKTTGFQMGHSFWQHRNPDHALGQAGVAVGYVTGKMDVTGDFLTTQQGDAGSIKAKTKSLMAYYTLATDKGTYLDTVLQYSMSNTDAKGQQSNVSLDAKGLRASLEVGIPVYFDSLTLEIQAQTIAYKDSFDDAIDSNGYVMSQGDNSGVIFRVGARLTPSDTSSNFKPWFAANVNKQNASTATGVMDNTNNVGLNSEKDSAWADVSVGMSFETEGGATVYGHLKQSAAIDGGKNTVTSGAIGVQKTW
jgi:outer membrane autotransporter protein